MTLPSGRSHPTPVFVLGLQRSGTTWLANILAHHPRAVAVEAEEHFGIHESIFFSHFARAYGDLADEESFRRFAAAFTTSDYYLLTGIEPEWLTLARPRTYAQAFRAVMDELAHRRGGADLWIEKSPHHTLLAAQLEAAFPDARFVAIVREAVAVVHSRIWSSGHRPPPYPARLVILMRAAWTCSLHQRWLLRFCRLGSNCLLTTYEGLAGDTEATVREICTFLAIEFDPAMLDVPWRRNTSFRSSDERRERSLGRLDALVVRAASALLGTLPLALLRWGAQRRQARRGIDWPEWCWRRRDAGPLPATGASRARPV